MVYKDDSWQIQNKKDQVDDLYNYNEVVLENWYDEYRNTRIIQSFQRYLKIKMKVMLSILSKKRYCSCYTTKDHKWVN